MLHSSASLTRLLAELRKLPGVGERTAMRLAFHLLKSPEHAVALSESLRVVVERVGFCSTCFGITEDDPCAICAGSRDRTKICVVEEPQDLLAVERSHAYHGLYHVLHGALSPMNGVTPGDLRVAELLNRLRGSEVAEVVIATNFSVEGEATAPMAFRWAVIWSMWTPLRSSGHLKGATNCNFFRFRRRTRRVHTTLGRNA
jgi:recombination protein RecR